MQAKFKVKNFGPIDEAELDLRNVNVLIGPQSSGKSVLAKLYTICKTPDSFLKKDYFDFIKYFTPSKSSPTPDLDVLKFHEALKEYNIFSFLNSKSSIEYNSEIHYFKYFGNKIIFKRKFEEDFDRLERCYLDTQKNQDETVAILSNYANILQSFKILAPIQLFQKKFNKKYDEDYSSFAKYLDDFNFTDINKDDLLTIFETLKYSERRLLSTKALYIPAERIIISILRSSTWSLQSNDIPIPKHILNFGALYEKASNEMSEVDLGFISENLRYKNVQGIDRIFISPKKSYLLTEAATGFQSLIPLLLPILGSKKSSNYTNASYVIEEPELNLYPEAQYSLMKFLESDRFENDKIDSTYIHTYTTHSPYILASFNNMLYAYKIGHKYFDDIEKKKKVTDILPQANWLNPNNFNAYVIKNGTAKQIFNREIGLIDDNEIDSVSDYMNDDFDNLMNI